MLLALLLAAAAPQLDATDETLEVTTSSTATLDVSVSFIEVVTATGAHAGGGSQLTQVTTATTTTVLAAPSASNTRAASQVKACNIGSAANAVLLKHDKATTERVFARASLAPSECLACNDSGDCSVLMSNGTPRQSTDRPGYTGTNFVLSKTATAADTVGYWYMYAKDTGHPGAWVPGTPGLNGTATDCSSAAGATVMGSPVLPDPASGGWYLTKFGLSAALAGSFKLIDVLWYNTGIVVTTTTGQAVTFPGLPARDLNGTTNGAGVRAALYTTTANTNAAAIANTTLTYTDQDGNAGNTATFFALAGYQAPVTPVVGTWMPFQLAAGDTGIRSVQTITLGTSYGAGALSLVLYRELAQEGVAVANFPSGSLVGDQAAGLNPGVRVYNDSCFQLVVGGVVAVTANPIYNATVQLMER